MWRCKIKHERKHYLIYQITNLVNGKIYIGAHQTDNIDDGYMGSGFYLKDAQKKHGISNFKKEILFDFDNANEMYAKEKELVSKEFIERADTYNIIEGGEGGSADTFTAFDSEGHAHRIYKDDPRFLSGEMKHVVTGTVLVKNLAGKCFRVPLSDPRYISGELKQANTGLVAVRDSSGIIFTIPNDDPRYLSGELVCIKQNRAVVVDRDGNRFTVAKDDPRIASGELVSYSKGKVNVVDKNGNRFRVSTTDERYLAGELKPCTGVKRHSAETKEKMRQARLKNCPWRGRKHTPEELEHLRKLSTGRKLSAEAREKIRIKATGRKLSEETKQKLREINLAKSAAKRVKHASEYIELF